VFANATMAGLLRPRRVSLAGLYNLTLVILGSLSIGFSAQLAIQLPFSPIPITAQTFAVLMIGTLFGARLGSLSVIAYIIEAAAGLPAFALGRAGPHVLLGPTGGYLLGFIFAAYITGALAEKGWDRRAGTTVLAMVLGNTAIYTFGLLWLAALMGINKTVLVAGLYPFIVGDCLKILLAAIMLPSAWKLLRHLRPEAKQE